MSDWLGSFGDAALFNFGGMGGFDFSNQFSMPMSDFGNTLMNQSIDTDWGNAVTNSLAPWDNNQDMSSVVTGNMSNAMTQGAEKGGGFLGGLFGEDGLLGGNLLGNGGLGSLLKAGMTIPAYNLQKDQLGMMQDMMDWQKQAYEDDVARQKQQYNYNVEQGAANQQYVADTQGNIQARDNYYDTPTPEEALAKWGM